MTTASDGSYASGIAKWTPGQQRPIVTQSGLRELTDKAAAAASAVPKTIINTATVLLADRPHADIVAETRRNTAIVIAGNAAGYWILVAFLVVVVVVLIWVLINIARDYMFKSIEYDNDY